jgi:hypothetical protein
VINIDTLLIFLLCALILRQKYTVISRQQRALFVIPEVNISIGSVWQKRMPDIVHDTKNKQSIGRDNQQSGKNKPQKMIN